MVHSKIKFSLTIFDHISIFCFVFVLKLKQAIMDSGEPIRFSAKNAEFCVRVLFCSHTPQENSSAPACDLFASLFHHSSKPCRSGACANSFRFAKVKMRGTTLCLNKEIFGVIF